MLKKVRKIVSFIIIVLLITTCALVVNKKTEFKIFGAKEVQANGHTLGSGVYIKVPQTHYVVEAGETIDIEVSVDTTGLSPDVVANAQIIAYPCDWYGYIEILYDGDDPYDNIISVQGVTEGKTAQISIGYYDADGNWIGGDDGEALDAYIEVEVVEPGSSPVTGGTLDMSSYTISTQTDFTQDGTNTMVFNSNLGENVDLTFDIPNPVATGLIVLAPYGDNAEQFQNCVEIVNNDMNIGKNTYSVTLKSLSGGHGIIRGGYVDVTAPPVGNDIQFIGGPFYIDWTIVDNTVHIPIEEICVEEDSLELIFI